MQRTQGGLTLVELMVVVAVMAILATVAYPLYTAQTQKARRAEAKTVLMELALAQERYFTVNGRYGTAAELGAAYTDAVGKLSDRDGDGTPDFYAIAVVPTTTSFSITATAGGAQSGDGACASFVVDQLGAKGATGTDTDKCW